MKGRLEGKVALITGAAKGIGKACASLFIEEGAFVFLSDIDDVLGMSVAQGMGSQAEYLSLDVAREDAWILAMEYILRKKKRLNILVNNAGIIGFSEGMGPQDPEHASFASWKKVHEVNADGVFLGCKHAISAMKEEKGSIVNISSRSGLVGIPGAAAYASSKASVRNHTKSVALYCCQQGYDIRCNSLHPAAILTPLWDPMLGTEPQAREKAIEKIASDIPMKKMGTPEDVAYAAVFLGSDESKYITGAELNIDGGILAGSVSSPMREDTD